MSPIDAADFIVWQPILDKVVTKYEMDTYWTFHDLADYLVVSGVNNIVALFSKRLWAKMNKVD